VSPATHIVTSLHDEFSEIRVSAPLSPSGRNRFGVVIVLEMTVGRVVWTVNRQRTKQCVWDSQEVGRRISGNC
jgi:hypothetical protein